MVGSDARIRVSSPMMPFLIGTLKSTRMKTRLPDRSRSLTESFMTGSRLQAPGSGPRQRPQGRSREPNAGEWGGRRPRSPIRAAAPRRDAARSLEPGAWSRRESLQSLADDVSQQVHAADRVAPLVV